MKSYSLLINFFLEFLFALFLFLGVIITEIWITQSSYFLLNQSLFVAVITFDLAILLPLTYYFWGIRYHKFNLFTLLPVIIISFSITYYILPPQHRYFLYQLEILLILLEIGFMFYALFKLRQIWRLFNKAQSVLPNFAHNLGQSFLQALGQNIFNRVLISEFVMFYFALWGWRIKSETKPNQLNFSTYQECGYLAIGITLASLSIIETLIFHLLIVQWSIAGAWIITGLSIYTFCFIVGDLLALVKSPVIVTDNQLIIRIGLRWYAEVPLNTIEQILTIQDIKSTDKPCLMCITFGSPNVLLHLKTPIKVLGIYGTSFTTRKIALNIDQADHFLRSIVLPE
jgi:hypothetical protein